MLMLCRLFGLNNKRVSGMIWGGDVPGICFIGECVEKTMDCVSSARDMLNTRLDYNLNLGQLKIRLVILAVVARNGIDSD